MMKSPSTPEGHVLEEGVTYWRKVNAERARLLVDAAAYYDALRRCLLEARDTVFIVGWDVDGRTRLVGEEAAAADGAPETLTAFLKHLVERRPELRVYILLWDYAPIYALEREPLPTINLDWRTPPEVSVLMDRSAPIEASHHQKIVVIDDAIAFCGGLDITIRRWDTPDHAPGMAARADPAGERYDPYHDIQAMVTGEAAQALGELVRDRWAAAGGEALPPPAPRPGNWPCAEDADFIDVPVAIARTSPDFGSLQGAREIEALYLRAVASAERELYIENQYLANERILQAIADRVRQAPGLEMLIISPETTHGWLEEQVMGIERRRFLDILGQAGAEDRVAVVYPRRGGDGDGDGDGASVMVHSKVMIVDDKLLIVGSANINNRSMGTDTECNIVIPAEDEKTARTITANRDHLLAHFLGRDAEEVRAARDREGSLIAAVRSLNGGAYRLEPIRDDGEAPLLPLEPLKQLGDPSEPISPIPEMDRGAIPADRERGWLSKGAFWLGCLLFALIAMALAWRFTPLAELTDISAVESWLTAARSHRWMWAYVLITYVLLGLAVFPVVVLILATAAVFGPWLGFAYALIGTMASALVTYALGRRVGAKVMEQLNEGWVAKARRAFKSHGITAIIALRMIPVAPFSVINFMAGASRVRLRDYALGTIAGMAPGMAIMTALGSTIVELWRAPDMTHLALVAGAAAIAVAFFFGLRHILIKRLPIRSGTGSDG